MIRMKEHRQPLNPLKISYEVLHPSFFRRHGFRWLETNPEIEDYSYSSAYGTHLKNKLKKGDISECREWMQKNVLKDKQSFYTNFYEASKCSSEVLAKNMGIKN